MRIAVLGAGNGGQAMAAYLALKGAQVNLYNRSQDRCVAIRKLGGINLSGLCKGFGRLNLVTSRVELAIRDAELIMVVTPAVAHRSLARKMAPYLRDGQIIILNPGRTGGALEFYSELVKSNCRADVAIAETQTFLFASRIIGPAEVRIYGKKERVFIATFPSKRIWDFIDDIQELLPEFTPVENVLKTSLDNIGAIFHPAPTLLNIAWIESPEDFNFYKQGISPSICRILEKMDNERMEVAYAFGIDPLSAKEWLHLSYGIKGRTLYELIQNNKQYQGILAPGTINHRYVFEDVPMSLVPLASLARVCNVETPTIDMIIDLANIVYQKDLRAEGRTIETLGLEGLSSREILELVIKGYPRKKILNKRVSFGLMKKLGDLIS
ncbi:MAG: NAD(P)-binding domain-containing protein [Halanaerobiaceae bacterium]|nr:NAD(P)-binding domain-containing protein [Halanaerobiaceae bacterium]